jgi:hypothetical protein
MVPGNVVVAETYPAEYYRWFFNAGLIKTKRESRRQAGSSLLTWASSLSVSLAPELQCAIEDGFPEGDDAFDAVVGLFGMLDVLLQRRAPGEPEESGIRQVEGWIFGQVWRPASLNNHLTQPRSMQ